MDTERLAKLRSLRTSLSLRVEHLEGFIQQTKDLGLDPAPLSAALSSIEAALAQVETAVRLIHVPPPGGAA